MTRLNAHVAAAVARHGRRGWRIDKPKWDDKIDAVVALCMALDRMGEPPGPDPASGLAVRKPRLALRRLADGQDCNAHRP